MSRDCPRHGASRRRKDFKPPEDALAISRVRTPARILGKTNVPLGSATGRATTTSTHHHNPFDLGRTPGGSPAESAAALAAGYGRSRSAADIAARLRVPAFHCGVCAHKPTFSLVPSRGTVRRRSRHCRSIAIWGDRADGAQRRRSCPAARRDRGAGPRWTGKAYRLALPPSRHRELKDFRMLMIDTDPVMPTSASVRTAIGKLAISLGKAGVTVTRNSPLLPDFAASTRLYMRMLMSFLA